MIKRKGRDVISRSEKNPLITLRDVPFQCMDVHNAGVVCFEGQYLLLVTIEMLEGFVRIYPARSSDGYNFTVEDEPFMAGAETGPFAPAENLGVRDPRVTYIDGCYYIAYIAQGTDGFRVGLARTKDFTNVERVSLVSQPDTKGCALFPRKIKDKYAILTRPEHGGSIWISYSEDLVYWGCSDVVLSPRGGFWDANKVGAAAPPIETDAGWLLIYYGEKFTSAGPLFRLGAAVLDKKDPSKVLVRSNIPILAPRERYERLGDVGNLVFSCGALLPKDDTLQLYYGGADSCICLGTAPLSEILHICSGHMGGI